MNIAAGTPLERGKDLRDINPKSYLEKMISEKFNGYISIAIKGKNGFEEGTVVFHNGDLVSSDYDYYKFNKNFKSGEGLERSLNAMHSKEGILDSFSLSSYQVQLVLTLNEEANLKEKVTNDNLKVPDSFSFKYEEELEKELPKEEMSKEQLFNKLGLSDKAGEKTTKEVLIEKAKEEDKDIIKTVVNEREKKEDEKVRRLQELLRR